MKARSVGLLTAVLLAGGAAVAIAAVETSSGGAVKTSKALPPPPRNAAGGAEQPSPPTRTTPSPTTGSATPSHRAPGSGGAKPSGPCSAVTLGKSRYTTGTARHLVFAISSAYSSTHVTVTECVKTGRTWKTVSTTSGRAGVRGFAPPGAKREGDGKTPTGSYVLSAAFGTADPGTALPYRALRKSGECWGATPGKSTYNKYYAGSCGSADENLSATMLRGPYRQAVVIDYNLPNPVSGRGSAIFLHVGGMTPTAGCISVTEGRLRAIMRTLRKGDRMIMGPSSALFRS